MDRKKIGELYDAGVELHFVVVNISEYDDEYAVRFPIEDGLLGRVFDFGSLLEVVSSCEYWLFDDCESCFVDTGDYEVRTPLRFVFEDRESAENLRRASLIEFYKGGLRFLSCIL